MDLPYPLPHPCPVCHLWDKPHPCPSDGIWNGSQAEQGLGRPLAPLPFTYGGDHCACKEEAAPEVPVAGVGGVAFGVHTLHPGFQDDLWK